MSGAVGSMPSLTRSGLPSFFAASSFFRSASAGRESTALRARDTASAADFDAFFGTAPMLNDRSPAPAPLDNAANRPRGTRTGDRSSRLSPFRKRGSAEAGRRFCPRTGPHARRLLGQL